MTNRVAALASGKPLRHVWSACVGAGRANEGLRADWQQHLRWAVLAPHLTLEMHRDKDLLAAGLRFRDELELLRYMLDSAQPNTCLMFWFSNVVQDGVLIDRIYDLLQERGLTPSERL